MFKHCKNFFRHCCGKHHSKKVCSLKDLPVGKRAVVLDFIGNECLRGRLCSMGLTPGTEIEAGEGFSGIRRLRVRGSELALDCEVAEQVLCEETCLCCNK